MALVKCKDCNNDISDKAITCPHCGATRRKARTTTKRITTNKSSTRRKQILWASIIALTLILAITVGVALLKPKEELGKKRALPILMKSYIDESRSSMLDRRVTVHARIENRGGDGNVLIAFFVYQGKKEYKKNKVVYMQSNQKDDFQMLFEEVREIDGPISHSVTVIAQ